MRKSAKFLEDALYEYFPGANTSTDIGKFANNGLQIGLGYTWRTKPMAEKLRSVV